MLTLKVLLQFALAALAGPMAATGLLFHQFSLRWSLVTSPFALVGTMAIALAFARLAEAGWPRRLIHLLIVPLGGILGWLLLLGDPIGAVYGALTAAVWSALVWADARLWPDHDARLD